MEKKVFKIITKRIKQVALKLIILFCLCVVILFVTMDAGWNYTYTEKHEISMEFHADFFLVNEKDTGTLHISFSDTDMSKIEITEDDISFKGFSADITYFNVSEYGDHVFCLMSLSNITTTSDLGEKTIELKKGVASIHGKDSSPLKLKIYDNHFVSMRQFMILNIFLSIAFNILFFIYANIHCDGDIAASMLLWIGSIVCQGYPFAFHIKIINLNLDYSHTCFVLLLVIIELSFCLWVGKRTLKSRGYSLFIILLSTLTIAHFSQIFSLYYLHLGQAYNFPSIDTLTIYPNFNFVGPLQDSLNRILYYIELSFRYFFTFPPDEYYGLIAILQFSMGKVYEIVVFGSVGSIILELKRKKP